MKKRRVGRRQFQPARRSGCHFVAIGQRKRGSRLEGNMTKSMDFITAPVCRSLRKRRRPKVTVLDTNKHEVVEENLGLEGVRGGWANERQRKVEAVKFRSKRARQPFHADVKLSGRGEAISIDLVPPGNSQLGHRRGLTAGPEDLCWGRW